MADALGGFIFGIAVIVGVVFSLVFIGLIRFVMKRGWLLSVTAGVVIGFLLGFFLSPYLFTMYINFMERSF
jgi:hypothetical protein